MVEERINVTEIGADTAQQFAGRFVLGKAAAFPEETRWNEVPCKVYQVPVTRNAATDRA